MGGRRITGCCSHLPASRAAGADPSRSGLGKPCPQRGGSPSLLPCPVQAFCLLSALFGKKIALLEVDLAALLRSQPHPGVGARLSVLPRYGLPGRMCACVRSRWEDLVAFSP